MKTVKQFALIIALFSLLATGCKTMSKSQKGAVIGAAGGGVVGGVIGKAAGNTALGAIIGAAVGGATGAIIGRKMDKQAEEMKEVLGDAEVIREGEGIIILFKEKVLFAYDKADLNTNAETNLVKLTNVLQKYPDTNIEIIGHTDANGSDVYNQSLSERRAVSVSAFLKSRGIPATRITTKGLGETDAVATNDTDEGRAMNRRVEFVITANEKMKADAQKESGN